MSAKSQRVLGIVLVILKIAAKVRPEIGPGGVIVGEVVGDPIGRVRVFLESPKIPSLEVDSPEKPFTLRKSPVFSRLSVEKNLSFRIGLTVSLTPGLKRP